MALLTRNDVIIRSRKIVCCAATMADDLAKQYSNGVIPCKADINKFQLIIAYIKILKCYEPPIAETLASGNFTITGTTGSIWVTVNAVPITSVAVDFNTDLTTTATDIVTAVGATVDVGFESTPNYTASSALAVVTVDATAGSGSKPNRDNVISAITTGDMAVTSVTNMTGGVDARVDGDNCFTSASADNVFDHLEELTGVQFAAKNWTYIDPVAEEEATEDLITPDGTALRLPGTAAQAVGDIITVPIINLNQ